MEILARDHSGDPRLGPLCLQLIGYESPRRDTFLRVIAERSPDRVVKGRATLAFAEYLRMKATSVEMLQHPDAPENLDKMKAMIITFAGPEALASINPPLTDAATGLHKQREELAQHAPEYLKHLLAADPAALHRESEQLYARVIKEFGDVPHVRRDDRPTRETLADVARRETGPRQPIPPGAASRPLTVSFRSLDDAYQAAERTAQQVSNKIGPNVKGLEAYKATAPRWADYGRKMWKLAEENPRHPDAFEALLWIVGHPIFFDNDEERAAITGQAVDALLRDHLDAIAADLAARNVAKAFNMGHPIPSPHVDRLYRALYERSPNREARGRMGLNLARFLKAEADLAESFTTRGIDPRSRPELAIWPPSYIARLRTTDTRELRRETESILERVKADYGDVKYLNGMVLTNDTLATVADRELADVRTLAVGQPAPEINGEDIDGKPMALSEFRGKVILLDFFSHSHRGPSRLAYPRLRTLVERYRNRPFVVLGISNNDARQTLKELETKKEITWRCWWDHARDDGPGPITTRWNIRGSWTFIVLDRDGTIRFKDLSPMDEKAFDEAIEALVKQAEAVAPPR
jgi:peroxiredoxin